MERIDLKRVGGGRDERRVENREISSEEEKGV
jgi:hypothetical protein